MPEITPKDKSLRALEGLHLWHAPMSSCSQRVRLTLAEVGRPYQSHIVRLERDEHATPEYQAIHPKGLVPALVDDGRLFIESIDIIQHLAGDMKGEAGVLSLADSAQADLKLLTFEYLFRANPPPPDAEVQAFQSTHQNDWLRQFRRDFADGFDLSRVHNAVTRSYGCFAALDSRLADGRPYLCGDSFSLGDIAWMPNVHRFDLMGWPFDVTPHLAAWFERVKARASYGSALTDWQPQELTDRFHAYVQKRRRAGTDIRSAPVFEQERDQHA